jgi:hypothetical protein
MLSAEIFKTTCTENASQVPENKTQNTGGRMRKLFRIDARAGALMLFALFWGAPSGPAILY